jgi:hypothetical protein
MRCLYPFGLILASLCSTVLALYESDVGIVDWHHPLVGVPHTSSLNTAPTFHSIPGRPPTEALLLTATTSNVLAALRASDGQLGAYQPRNGYLSLSDSGTAWRFIFAPTDHIIHYQQHRDRMSCVFVRLRQLILV